MKSYTDLEQSKKLAEILPIESADMFYFLDPTPAGNIYHLIVQRIDFGVKTREPEYDKGDIPCWSLAALLDALPTGKVLLQDKGNHGYKCICNNIDTYFHDNPIDTCYEMILKLKEKNLL